MLFCEKGEETGQSDGRLWQVRTFAVDTRVRECASLLDDFRLLSKLSEGHMIATEASLVLSRVHRFSDQSRI